MAMTHALTNFSLSTHLGTAEVEGQRDGKLDEGKCISVCYRVIE